MSRWAHQLESLQLDATVRLPVVADSSRALDARMWLDFRELSAWAYVSFQSNKL